jgi:hypothetical protein
MSAQHGTLAQNRLGQRGLAPDTRTQNTVAQNSGAAGSRRDCEVPAGLVPTGLVPAGLGGGALTRAVERWRRAMLQDQARPTGSPAPSGAGTGAGAGASTGRVAGSAGDGEALAALARRLDDSGCSYGRVSAARLESVTRAYDRLETKMNAVLMAVTGTFLSTLAGLLLYYVRGAGQ